MRRAIVVLGAASAALALASALVSCLLDTGGLTNASPTTAAADASPDDGGDADVDVDSGGAVRRDAGACEPGAYLFCDSFDDRDAANLNWSSTYRRADGGDLRIDSLDAVSLPNSLFARVPSHTGLKQLNMVGEPINMAGRKKLTIELDVSIETVTPITAGCYGRVLGIEDGVGRSAKIYFDRDTVSITAANFPGGEPRVAVPIRWNEGWHYVIFEYIVDATNGGVAATVDGVRREMLGGNTLGPDPLAEVAVLIGVYSACNDELTAIGDVSARFDNVKMY